MNAADHLDNLDRQLLGYISQHPSASFAEMARELRCAILLVDQRLSALYANGFLQFAQDKRFLLTDKAKGEYSLSFQLEGSESAPSFDWIELYIPDTLE